MLYALFESFVMVSFLTGIVVYVCFVLEELE